MDWRQARDETLADWRRIRAAIGSASPVELLADIHASCALCEMATAEKIEGERRCARCLVLQQFGGCAEISGLMSEKVVERNWDGLRELVDRFIGRLEAVELHGIATLP